MTARGWSTVTSEHGLGDGEIQPAVAISDVDVSYHTSLNPFTPGRVHIAYTVTNTGNIRLGSRQQAEIAGSFGLPTGADTGPGGLVGRQREILPGQQATVEADVEGVWPLGRISTDIIANQQAAGDDSPLGELDAVSATATKWALPWPQLIVVLIAAGLVLAWRRRRRDRRAELERMVAEARADGERRAAATAVSPDG